MRCLGHTSLDLTRLTGLQTSLLQCYPNHHLGRTPRGSLAAGRALERGGRRQAGGSLCPGGCRDCWGCTCAPFLPCHAQAPSSELARTRRPGLTPPLATLRGSCRQGSTALPAPVSDAPPGGAPHPAAAPCPGCPVPTHPRSPCSAPPPGLTGQEAGCRDTRDRPRPQGKGGFSGSPDGADHVLTTGLKPECQRPLPPGPAPTCSSRQRLCFSEIWLFRACFSFSSCSRDSVGQSSRSSSQRAFSCGDGRAKR